MSLKGIIVNGTTYQYDYEYLDNKPEIPDIPEYSTSDLGKYLTIDGSGLKWDFSNCYVGTCAYYDDIRTGAEDVLNDFFPSCDTQGYVLTADGMDNVSWADLESMMNTIEMGSPPATASEGYVLITDSSGGDGDVHWVDFESMVETAGVSLPTCNTEGYVLTINDQGTPSWDQNLPTCSTEGYVLMTDDQGDTFWTEPSGILPTCDTEGYILISGGHSTRNANWVEPSGALPEPPESEGYILITDSCGGGLHWMTLSDAIGQYNN